MRVTLRYGAIRHYARDARALCAYVIDIDMLRDALRDGGARYARYAARIC